MMRPEPWKPAPRHAAFPTPRRRLLILGANGALGGAFRRACDRRGLAYEALSRREVDVSVRMEVRRAISACRPWGVVNATGYQAVDAAEAEADRCRRDNTDGALHVAEGCERIGARLLTFSSDLVFDGMHGTPYLETDATRALSVYGRSKEAAEDAVRARHPSALIVRTGPCFGTRDGGDFLARALSTLASGAPVAAPRLVVTPTHVPDLVEVSLDLLIDGACGLRHLSSQTAIGWCDFVRLAARHVALEPALVQPCDPAAIGWLAPRPAYSALGSVHGRLLPTLDESLEEFAATHDDRLALARA